MLTACQLNGGCSKLSSDGKCTVYADPSKVMSIRTKNRCPFNQEVKEEEKKKVNPLKQARRAAKGL